MIDITDEEFEKVVADGIDQVPQPYQASLSNIAFIVEDEPSEQQRKQMALRPGESLYGLYEGVPLPQRGGVAKLLPDKITIFKKPLVQSSWSMAELRQRVGHTIWHEVAHYFGLDHARIDELDNKQ